MIRWVYIGFACLDRVAGHTVNESEFVNSMLESYPESLAYLRGQQTIISFTNKANARLGKCRGALKAAEKWATTVKNAQR